MFIILKETNLVRDRSLTKQALRPRVEINQSRLVQTLLWHWALIITRHNGNSRRIAVVVPITTGFGYRFPSLWVIFMMVMVVMMMKPPFLSLPSLTTPPSCLSALGVSSGLGFLVGSCKFNPVHHKYIKRNMHTQAKNTTSKAPGYTQSTEWDAQLLWKRVHSQLDSLEYPQQSCS